jgi:hypothetical protein
MKQFFQQPMTPDWELPEWINEGDQLNFEGRFQLTETVCSTPINSAQPVEWAVQLARRELALEQFGKCRVSGGDHSTVPYKPGEGITETGRVVVLPMPDAADSVN